MGSYLWAYVDLQLWAWEKPISVWLFYKDDIGPNVENGGGKYHTILIDYWKAMSVFQAGDGVFFNLERSGLFQQTLKRYKLFDNGFDMGLWEAGNGEFKDDSQVYFFKNRADGNEINREREDKMRSRFNDRVWRDSKFGFGYVDLDESLRCLNKLFHIIVGKWQHQE